MQIILKKNIMSEEIELLKISTKESMQLAITHLEKEFLNIRAGKANPVMLNTISIDYYGQETPLSQVANINTPDARTISIQPWEKSFLQEIEKAIMNANIGYNPMNNGESIIINIPPLTEERRKELAKIAKNETENAKVSIRNSRKNANNEVKKSSLSDDEQNNFIIDIQNITDNFIKKAEEIYSAKEKEILTV